MSGEPPIELPGLSALRSGPSAAVCASGHVFSWFSEPGSAPKHCAKCGEPVLAACPSCKSPLPADGEMLAWVPYHSYCRDCGSAYPWRADEMARIRRALAELTEAEGWSDELRARAGEVVDDIAAERAAASSVVAAVKWLESRGAENAAATILDAVDRLGSVPLKQALRPSFPGLF